MTDILLLAFIFLIAGVVSVPVATRLGIGSVLGYLVAGVAISPVLALLDVDVHAIQQVAELGVVLMLFLIGLELEPRYLWQMRLKVLGLGGGQIVLTTAVVAGLANMLGHPWNVSVAIGLVLALSSTAITLQTLTEKGLLKSPGGESGFFVLLTQDVAVIPILAVVPLLAIPELAASAATSGTEGHGPALSLVEGMNGWQTAVVTLCAVGIVILGGNYLTRPALRFIAVTGLREIFVATALAIVVTIALLMVLVGLSPALGAFIAGVVLANSEYRHELESDIDPFRGLLLGLFFITVGAGINFALLWESLPITIGLTLGLIAIKGAILFLLGTAFGLRGPDRWLLAIALSQAGEFGFVLLSFSVANAVLPAAFADQLLLVIAMSMLLTPLLFIVHERVITDHFISEEVLNEDEFEEPGEVIIAGYGRIGTIVDRMLLAAGYKTTVIDYDSKQIDMLRRFGARVYFGDATRPDLLKAAGIDRAKVLVIAIDDVDSVTQLAKYAIHSFPDLHVIASARNRHHVYDLWAVGCRDIIRETYDSSLRVGRSAYEALGIPRAKSRKMVEAFNDLDHRAMLEVADSYDPALPLEKNDAYVARVKEMRGPWEQELGTRIREILRDG
ncbi:MAG: cation:proton antiporter [Boseongicola sp.]|nr:cation:proton antiporter [Boseongicola sp.]